MAAYRSTKPSEADVGGSQLGLQSEPQASQGYTMKSCLKEGKKKKRKEKKKEVLAFSLQAEVGVHRV